LSGVRTGLIETDLTPLMAAPNRDSPVKAYLEAGVIVAMDSCAADWCKVEVEGTKGWMEKTALWGVRPDEAFD
jgi:SH3-like domain-containing protein